MRFVDTNVLIYSVCGTESDARKTDIALKLLDRPDLALSTQVVQEFYVQATRAGRSGALTHGEAVAFIRSLERFRIQETTIAIVHHAFSLCQRYGVSYWDSAILAAAAACGCDTVYSEDLSSGQRYEDIVVVNPFSA